MGLLGIDLGNWSCHVMYDILDSRAEVIKTQISQIKCLLGRKFSDPELQLELDYVPFRVIEGANGYPLVHSRCKGEDRGFTPVEILAMLISYLESLEREQNSDSSPSPSPCIGTPMYFTDGQKKEMLRAAKIAGLPGLFCLDETTAMLVTLTKIFVDPPIIVVIVDIGHASMNVCFAELEGQVWHCSSPIEIERSVDIIYKGYDRSLGGREFNKVLFNHFASNIRKEYNIDVFENSIACVRLSEACESMKHDLSENYEASFCLKKFSGSIDVEGSITRKEFERLSCAILKKIKVVLEKALSESRANVNNIFFIEAIGNGCPIPAIIKILEETFGRTVTLPLHNEDVARGCAMQAGQLKGQQFHNIMGTDLKINDLTTGRQTSDLFSGKDSEMSLWRRAMDKDGHLLTFLNDFLEQNMHRIERSEKTKDESYWLSYGSYFGECSYIELQDATNDFQDSFKLGEGGFGIVYKGILRNTTVAIKMLKEGSTQGEREFNQEVKILSKVRHPNLVRLIGACVEPRALIYEYAPNGSLEDRLRCEKTTFPLSWQARVRIAFEICSTLSFLHCSEPHGIVHGDLKPSNILLDGNDTSKLFEFGLSCELNYTDSAGIPCHWTDCVAGTAPYMDPEYVSTGKTTKCDVYSFGILLLWLVTSKQPHGIRELVEGAHIEGTLKALIDASAGPWPFREAEKLISLGLRSSDPMRNNRPDLSTEVLKEITSMLQVANYCGDYSYSELQDATNNFHESLKLGEGGFGIVYKGIIHNTTVAIKMLKEGSSQGAKEFNQEIEILIEVQHPNLVKLIGACAEPCALIYEYLPNGSLEDRLRCKDNTSPLSWQERVRIAFEMCSALSFLHSIEPHGIVHGDLKPDNILLDGNDTSKICDFGLCRELDYTDSASIPYYWTDCPKGTLAYMDLEYLSTGKTTPHYDVYSFGIILLRLVTCKDPRGIRNMVEEAQKKNTLKDLIDASAEWPFKVAKKMISLGLRCSDPMRKNRPNLSTKVLKEINSMLQFDSAPSSSWAASLFNR